ncbi:hypothetical protein [uncultured Algimonas sp.]|uniref:hypothetical protein n=1 Tax=uncultured Algimonas sp. TaxID=1547920 RepID=UPI00261DFBE5|nr:hypothetical protein [uncultured Algimonas sp.]
MGIRARISVAAVLATLSLPLVPAVVAHAQSIKTEELDAPKAFAPGIDIADELAADAWAGTSAARAVRLLEAMPADTDHPVVRDMLRRVVLSGLVPPQGAADAFERSRIAAARDLANPDEYARFAARNPAARDPRLRAEAHITQGDLAAACDISDTVQRGRGETFWVRLRAGCHTLRGETSSADLARDILRDRGEETELVIPDPPSGFWAEALAQDAVGLDAMMTALALGPDGQDGGSVQSADDGLAGNDPALRPTPLFPAADPDPAPLYDLTDAIADRSEIGTARLFVLGRDGNARAAAAFVRRAEADGLNPYAVLPRIPAVLDPAGMVAADLPLFARYAVISRDIDLIRSLFESADDVRAKERLALASDALGGGFIGRPLGDGLDAALSDGRDGAVKDVMLALALGADLTEPVETRLREAGMAAGEGAPVLDWVAVDHAVDRAAKAESLLRLADILNDAGTGDEAALYRVLRSLREAGFADTAGQLAAFEYLRGLGGA